MRNLASASMARREKFTSKKGLRILRITGIPQVGNPEINYNEHLDTEGHLGRWDNELDDNPVFFEKLGGSESFECPDNSYIEINGDVSSEHNHPNCVTCVTPTLSTRSSLNDSFIEEENVFQSQGVNSTTDDVIVDLREQELENLGNVDNFIASEGGLDTINIVEDPFAVLSKLRASNPNRPIIGHLNVNFLASKFELLKDLIKDKLDILVVTETKIDDSYPTAQFNIDGFSSPFRLDRNKFGGGVIVYVKEHLFLCRNSF